MSSLNEIEKILENQLEVKYLTYFLHLDSSNKLHVKLSTMGFTKNLKYSSIELFLNDVVPLLSEMKSKEKYLLKQEEKKKTRRY